MAGEPTSPDRLASDALRLLHDVVLEPYVHRVVDHVHGGYLVGFDHALQPVGNHRKSLEHASRTAMAFAMLHRADPGAGFAPMVAHGVRFLQEQMWDQVNGGFYAAVERDGTPVWDGLKHPHAVTYAVRCFALADDALPDGESRRWTFQALDWLDQVAWRPATGGYVGTFRRDNRPYGPGEALPTDHGDDPLGLPAGLLEMNTQSDALGMMVDVHRRFGGDAALDRLHVLVDHLTTAVQPSGMLPFLLRADWTPMVTPGRLGHQFQTVRRFIEAGALTGRGDVTDPAARRMARHALERCRHPGGGYPLEHSELGHVWSTMGSAADARQWWVQLEALDAFALLASHPSSSPDEAAAYGAARDEQWHLIVDLYADQVNGGFRELPCREPEGSRRGVPWRRRRPGAGSDGGAKTHAWKDMSHEVAVLLALAG